ncbi:hypothetical protein [Paenibacillus macquariensis]|uniref:HD domain-containing protein n=1 Tax=Paenibacillus macquariensis TaxID=948756 RepID=A0ABY1KFE7_9BACL|nr:hypothetical protein [Paenibacillus macquariensis]MEC0093208.1 hypothetical protein [Paenibacillus macquariensis]OAB35049.1 hypothetical protein PMSM_10705 [Paenibacillus macquariensis subsp. macquariensis]SIR62796.1 hypothetical protein SAMN05421578_12437 [Paenibacillus macquariensis]
MLIKSGTINQLLYKHLKEGEGVAEYLRLKIPGLVEELEQFFITRSDIKRIQKAEALAERILELTDFYDLVPIRSGVATLEIKRRISYDKQTDHTAHTLYLFFLGIWVYDNIPSLRTPIDDSIKSSNPIHMFLFQWTYASLLHDIGYLFSEVLEKDAEEPSSVSIFDSLFNIDSIKRYAGITSKENNVKLEELWRTFEEKYKITPICTKNSMVDIIHQLDHIPWLVDLGLKTVSGLDALMETNINESTIRDFSISMATEGYSGNTVVDHGVASGLMLLKYSSIWYWICNEAKNKDSSLHEELTKYYKYPLNVFIRHVIPACKATAYHNLTNTKFNLTDNPMLFLAVLCDELQVWDRFLSGRKYIDNWSTVEHCMSEDVLVEKENSSKEQLLHFTVSNYYHEKITSTLENRVANWKNYVRISTK